MTAPARAWPTVETIARLLARLQLGHSEVGRHFLEKNGADFEPIWLDHSDWEQERFREDAAALLALFAPFQPAPVEDAAVAAIAKDCATHHLRDGQACDCIACTLLAALQAARAEGETVKAELSVSRAIGDSFWLAIKRLNLPAINVADPGSHVTALIDERDALRAQLAQVRDKTIEEIAMLIPNRIVRDTLPEVAWAFGSLTADIIKMKSVK